MIVNASKNFLQRNMPFPSPIGEIQKAETAWQA
jgi:hypothetical protein